MKIVVASEPSRADLFAEVHYNNQPWAEIVLDREAKRFVLTLYPLVDGPLGFFLGDAELAIAEARAALEARGYTEG